LRAAHASVVDRTARYGDGGLLAQESPRRVAVGGRSSDSRPTGPDGHEDEGRPAWASAPLRTCQVQRTGYFFFFAAFFFVPFFFAAFFLAMW